MTRLRLQGVPVKMASTLAQCQWHLNEFIFYGQKDMGCRGVPRTVTVIERDNDNQSSKFETNLCVKMDVIM